MSFSTVGPRDGEGDSPDSWDEDYGPSDDDA